MNKRLPDAECRARAGTHLRTVLGAEPDDLRWDGTHHLQGRAHIAGRELVVIAPRDDVHHALVFTPEDWNEFRRSSAEQRTDTLRRCVICDHDALLRILAA